MLTTTLLARDWEQYAIVTRLGGTMTPMTEKFENCLGVQDGVAVFVIKGMKEEFEQSKSRLAVGDDGYSCYDYGVAGQPFHVGHFTPLNATLQ